MHFVQSCAKSKKKVNCRNDRHQRMMRPISNSDGLWHFFLSFFSLETFFTFFHKVNTKLRLDKMLVEEGIVRRQGKVHKNGVFSYSKILPIFEHFFYRCQIPFNSFVSIVCSSPKVLLALKLVSLSQKNIEICFLKI